MDVVYDEPNDETIAALDEVRSGNFGIIDKNGW